MSITRMNDRGAVTIPKSVRQYMKLSAGQAFLVSVAEDGAIRLRPVRPKRSLRDFVGAIRPAEPSRSLEDEEKVAEDQAVADVESAEVGRA